MSVALAYSFFYLIVIVFVRNLFSLFDRSTLDVLQPKFNEHNMIPFVNITILLMTELLYTVC